jgi:hypothetical protein
VVPRGQLRPPATQQGGVTSATSSSATAQQAQSVAAGLQGNALLVDLTPPVQPAPPLLFDVGLCTGGADVVRLPHAGELRWTGSGAPQVFGTTSTGTPASSPSAIASPTAPLGGPDPTALPGACSAIPMGTVPAYLQVSASSSGVKPDPRSQVPTQSVRAALGASPVGVSAPFAIVAVVLPQGASAPRAQSRVIDAAGTEQLYSYFDGQHLHKALRTFQNGAWTIVIDTAANVITFALTEGPNGAAFYWTGIHPGDRFGFIAASSTGCSDFGLDSTLTPTLTVSG